MRDYVIVTDSCCDFPPELVQELGVTVIPLSVQLGNDRFHNTPEEAPDSHVFYTRLSQGEPAQTSAPNVEEFKDCFRPFLQAGQDVLYLGFSSGLSGTYHNAAIAAEADGRRGAAGGISCGGDPDRGHPLCFPGPGATGGPGRAGTAQGQDLAAGPGLCP